MSEEQKLRYSLWKCELCNDTFITDSAQNKDEIGRLLKLERDLSQMFDSDTRIALALLEEIRKINKDE